MAASIDTASDVIVVGSGNAALCAAMAARETGARVLVLEKAPEHFRGGNSYFTAGGFRFAYSGLDDIRRLIPDMSDEETRNIDVGRYDQAKFYEDMMRVTEGLSDPGLADTLVSRAFPTMQWLRERGMRWVLMFGRQAFKVGEITRFWGGLIVEAVGAGKGLSDREFEIAADMGVKVAYDTKAVRLLVS